MVSSRSAPAIDWRALIGVGILVPLLSVVLPLRYLGLVDWPAGAGFALLGMGPISIGVIYAGWWLYRALGSDETATDFRGSLGVACGLFPLVAAALWIATQPTALVQMDAVALAIILSSACAYFPIAFGVPLGQSDTLRQRALVSLLAIVSLSIPAYNLLHTAVESGGLLFVVPVGWIVSLGYSGLCAYPLYQFST